MTDAQQADFMKSQSELDGISRKKQIDAVGRGIEVNGQKYNPEAPLLHEGHGCIECMPDGTRCTPNALFIKVYPNGKVHAYPTTRQESR
ncbi:hypothetical protein [Streptomyces yangpuensis]|uniref:hypothetical protein n=1 Tax=Streptomyces yangpuensis TaxID=1648182 RepID=UPI0035D88DF2